MKKQNKLDKWCDEHPVLNTILSLLFTVLNMVWLVILCFAVCS